MTPAKIQQAKSDGKLMIIIFFNHKDLIYHHALPPKTIVKGENYVSVLKILLHHISRKHHKLVEN